MFLRGTTCTDDVQLPVHSSAGEPSGETHGNCGQECQRSAAECQTDRTTLPQLDGQWHELQSEQRDQRHRNPPVPSPAKQNSSQIIQRKSQLITEGVTN